MLKVGDTISFIRNKEIKKGKACKYSPSLVVGFEGMSLVWLTLDSGETKKIFFHQIKNIFQ